MDNENAGAECMDGTGENVAVESPAGIKLHIGCGRNYFKGWLNIDNNSDNNIRRLDMNWDLRNALPFPDNKAAFIYNEHFLEHLHVSEGVRVLHDFLRVLKPGGVLRVAMPDLQGVVAAYSDPDWKAAPWLKRFGMDFIQTPAELININFRSWGHQWLYDWEELERRLREAGAAHITRCRNGESRYPELRGIETRAESTLVAEVVKQALPFME